ncbi:25140_t:CDS:2 [Gigaspora margarita]|uniref:25140_t:CDS:1 n=1 Tax=Gigaspora margarita TaxID=4874 RepID=A0ABN7UIU9_GIGMA|nr:25140_t:CDS:2 [Gigaspora margarita]
MAIYEEAVQEVYNFRKTNSLISLWSYLWSEWYNEQQWPLWARYENKISILKTTMFVEGHWKVIKRYFPYKFFRPRLDLVVYILTKNNPLPFSKITANQDWQRKTGWIKQLKSEWKTLRFCICKHLVKQKGSITNEFFDREDIDYHNIEEDIDYNNTEEDIDYNNTEEDIDYSNIEEDIDENEYRTKRSQKYSMAKGIKKNFGQINKMIQDVEKYKNRKTLPQT